MQKLKKTRRKHKKKKRKKRKKENIKKHKRNTKKTQRKTKKYRNTVYPAHEHPRKINISKGLAGRFLFVLFFICFPSSCLSVCYVVICVFVRL